MKGKSHRSTASKNVVEITVDDVLSANSKKNYIGTTKAYKKFCVEEFNALPNFVGINEERVLAFLKAKSEGKLSKKKQKVLFAPKTMELAYSALKYYYKKHLNNKEFLKKVSCFDDPHSENVKLFLKAYDKTYRQRSLDIFLKRSGVEETYDEKQLQDMIAAGLNLKIKGKSYISTISQLVLSQSLILRGDNVRAIDFTDLKFRPDQCHLKNIAGDNKYTKSVYPEHGEQQNNIMMRSNAAFSERIYPQYMQHDEIGGTNADMLVLVSTKNKTNQSNKRNRAGFVRHVDVIFCAQFWLSVYLVERFHVYKVGGNISFDKKESFFNLKIFNITNKTTDGNDSISYNTQYARTKAMMKAANVSIENITHAPRASAAQICDQKGVSLEDIQRSGCWKNQHLSTSMLQSYLYNIVLGPMAALAGARKTPTGWKYGMHRSIVKPKKELKMKLFPFINDILEECADANFQNDNTKKMAYETAVTLDHLRTVFLQDFKFFQEVSDKNVLNKNAVFKHKIFKSKEYKEFRSEQDNFYKNYFDELKNGSEKTQNNSEPQYAKDLFEKLKQEILDLKKSNTELKQNFETKISSIIRSAIESTDENITITSNTHFSGLSDVKDIIESFQTDMKYMKHGIAQLYGIMSNKQAVSNFTKDITCTCSISRAHQDQTCSKNFKHDNNCQITTQNENDDHSLSKKKNNDDDVDDANDDKLYAFSDSNPFSFNLEAKQNTKNQSIDLLEIKDELFSTRYELSTSNVRYKNLEKEFSSTNSKFENIERDLSRTSTELSETSTELSETRKDLSDIKKEFEKLNQTNASILNILPFQINSTKDTIEKEKPEIVEDDEPDFSYVYSVTCTSFQEVWEEYKIAKDNCLSIEQLDEQYKAKWRNSESLRKKYSRKKRVYDAMKIGLSKNYTEQDCYELLEKSRVMYGKTFSKFLDCKELFPMELKVST